MNKKRSSDILSRCSIIYTFNDFSSFSPFLSILPCCFWLVGWSALLLLLLVRMSKYVYTCVCARASTTKKKKTRTTDDERACFGMSLGLNNSLCLYPAFIPRESPITLFSNGNVSRYPPLCVTRPHSSPSTPPLSLSLSLLFSLLSPAHSYFFLSFSFVSFSKNIYFCIF